MDVMGLGLFTDGCDGTGFACGKTFLLMEPCCFVLGLLFQSRHEVVVIGRVYRHMTVVYLMDLLCVCVYAHALGYMCVCIIHVHVWMCMCVCMCVCICASVHICVYVCMHMHALVPTCISVCVCVCMHMYALVPSCISVCVCMHAILWTCLIKPQLSFRRWPNTMSPVVAGYVAGWLIDHPQNIPTTRSIHPQSNLSLN